MKLDLMKMMVNLDLTMEDARTLENLIDQELGRLDELRQDAILTISRLTVSVDSTVGIRDRCDSDITRLKSIREALTVDDETRQEAAQEEEAEGSS